MKTDPTPWLKAIDVVLVGPMFGGNVGAAARAIRNTGLGGLQLVAPTYRDELEASRFAHGAEDLLEAAPRHVTLGDAIAGQTRVVGLTIRGRNRRKMVSLEEFARGWAEEAAKANQGIPTLLLFGRERDGLRNEELELCTELVWIPAHPDHPSFNLGQAVLLSCHAMFRASLECAPAGALIKPRRTREPSADQLATAAELADMYAHLRMAFLALGYAQEYTADHVVRSWQAFFERARPYRREVKMLRGLARQAMYMLREPRDPKAD